MAQGDEKAEESSKAKGGHARADALPPERKSEIAKLAAEARWSSHPLRVLEDADTGHRFVVYTTKDGLRADVRFDGEDPWFTQLQLAEIFGVDVRTVNEHIQRFTDDGELDAATIRDFRIVRQEGSRRVERSIIHYGLDIAFYVGYRVNSSEGKLFRRWATNMLVQLATKGFVIDVQRLENPDGRPDYFDELLDKIRHIRSSEKRMWTRVLELASFCSDYHVMGEKDKDRFFATIQNALHWAATQETAAEVIYYRVDASKPNAGLMHLKGDLPTVEEAKVAKNYYAEPEIKRLNLLTSAVLEFFESQAEQRRPTTLEQFLGKMRDWIKLDGRPLIEAKYRGSISSTAAKEKAAVEVNTYKERLRLERETDGEQAVGEMLAQARKLVEKKRAKRKKT